MVFGVRSKFSGLYSGPCASVLGTQAQPASQPAHPTPCTPACGAVWSVHGCSSLRDPLPPLRAATPAYLPGRAWLDHPWRCDVTRSRHSHPEVRMLPCEGMAAQS